MGGTVRRVVGAAGDAGAGSAAGAGGAAVLMRWQTTFVPHFEHGPRQVASTLPLAARAACIVMVWAHCLLGQVPRTISGGFGGLPIGDFPSALMLVGTLNRQEGDLWRVY